MQELLYGKKKLIKVYGIVQKLWDPGIYGYSRRFKELFRIKCRTFNDFSWSYAFYSEKFCKFCRTLP